MNSDESCAAQLLTAPDRLILQLQYKCLTDLSSVSVCSALKPSVTCCREAGVIVCTYGYQLSGNQSNRSPLLQAVCLGAVIVAQPVVSRDYEPGQQKQMAAGNTDMGILPGLHMPPSKVTTGAIVKKSVSGCAALLAADQFLDLTTRTWHVPPLAG